MRLPKGVTRKLLDEYPHVEDALGYADDVLKGEVIAGRKIKLAAQRFIDDLNRKDIELDWHDANRVCKFVETLKHTKGKWAASGDPIRLEPWQKFALVNIFGLKKLLADGTKRRKYQEVEWYVARKNGKSIIAGAIGLFMLALDHEYGSEVYCGATTEKQANEVFTPAKRMMARSPELAKFLGVETYASSITIPEDNSTFQKVIGNPPDGSSPHCGIVDEYHEHKTDSTYKTFQTGMGAREQPILFVITTAGDNLEGPCFNKRKECDDILNGIVSDEHADRTFVLMYEIDEEDDWTSREALAKANPNMGVSVSEEWLLAQQAQAIRSVKDQGYFKTKHLNVWVNSAVTFLNYEKWKTCADSTMSLDDFAMMPCKIGIDLSSKIDFTAAVTCFTNFDEEGRQHYYLFPTFWLPRERIEESYEAWADYITATEGEEIDTIKVKADLRERIEQTFCEEVTLDPWKSAGYEQELESAGAEITRFPQTIGHFTGPMNEFEAAVESGRLHHPDDPVLNWMISNLSAKRDTNGNVKPRKEDIERKIDGAVAAIMAVGRCMSEEDSEGSSSDMVVI